MNNQPNINTLMMLQQKIINKSKIRDISTFVIMVCMFFTWVPVLRFIISFASLAWIIAYIIIYFSTRNDQRILNALVRNLDPHEEDLSNQHRGFNLDPKISANWQHIFYNYNNDDVQHMLNQKSTYARTRDRWTFIYLIVGFVLGIILTISITTALISLIGTNADMSHSNIKSQVKWLQITVYVIMGINLLISLTWAIIYIINYRKIKHINTQLMLWGLPNNDQQNQDSQSNIA